MVQSAHLTGRSSSQQLGGSSNEGQCHAIILRNCERRAFIEHRIVVSCFQRIGRTESGGSGGDLSMGTGACRSRKSVIFYSDDAVLWGTTAPKIRAGRASLREYFVGVGKAVPGLTIDFGDQLIRVYGNTAVNSGYYTFSWVKDGETKRLPARYSFTYVKDGDRWLIVDHHSSALPSPPK
jgi:hypothetical protein